MKQTRFLVSLLVASLLTFSFFPQAVKAWDEEEVVEGLGFAEWDDSLSEDGGDLFVAAPPEGFAAQEDFGASLIAAEETGQATTESPLETTSEEPAEVTTEALTEVTTEATTEATTEEDLSNAFTDKTFRKYVRGLLGDKKITKSACAAVTTLDVRNLGIKSLDGVEFFPNLTTLLCGDEKETKNVIASLDLRENPKLEVLHCDNIKLMSLDVSLCPALKELSCAFNLLRSLDLRPNKELSVVLCYFNILGDLQVEGLHKLTELHCGYNEIQSLNLTGCEALTDLAFLSNLVSSIDLSGLANLQTLSCSENQLARLDVTKCKKLTELSCDANQMQKLLLGSKPALVQLFCHENKLKTLDLSGCSNLRELYCYQNNLKSLDIRALPDLTSLNVAQNKMDKAADVLMDTEPAWFNFEPQKAKSFTISPKEATLYLGTKAKSVTIAPSIQGSFGFSSSNKKVATVSAAGVVTAKKKGTAVITVYQMSNHDASKTCIVTVKKPSITADKKITVAVEEKATIKAEASPAAKIKFASSDISIATVSKAGVVKGKKEGTTTITLTANKVTKKVKVKVTAY